MKNRLLGQRDIIVYLAEILNRCNIPYLLTGSIAVSYYGRPRATHDIDFVIEIPKEESNKLLTVFKKLGRDFSLDFHQIEQAIVKGNFFDIFHPDSGLKIDFWLSKNEFDLNKFARKNKIMVNKYTVNLVSAEDILLTKLLWCKKIRSDRHLRDCVGIWQIQKNKLDMTYLNLWANKLTVNKLLEEIKVMNY